MTDDRHLLLALREPSLVLRHFGTALDRLGADGVTVTIVHYGINDQIDDVLAWCEARQHVRIAQLWTRPDERAERERRRNVRLGRDYASYFADHFDGMGMLRDRARDLAPESLVARFPLDRPPSRGEVATLVQTLIKAEAAAPALKGELDLLDMVRPDAVIVSPLVEFGSPQVDILKAAAARGVPSGLAVASWDNLTNKGQMRIVPDLVTVWNDAQRKEAVAIHGVPAENVVLTGAQTFDAWFARAPSQSRADWMQLIGLGDRRHLILYLCSSSQIGGQEDRFIRQWVEAVRQSPEAALRDAGILIRPHPRNLVIWDDSDIEDLPGVSLWNYEARAGLGADRQADFFDSLAHADLAVGLNTSSQIEAAIAGTPVFSIVDDATAPGTLETIHFRHLMAEHGGPTHIARGLDEHVRQLAEAMQAPDRFAQINDRFVDSFVRPFGRDVAGADKLAEAFLELTHRRVNGAAVRPTAQKSPLFAESWRRRADRLVGYNQGTRLADLLDNRLPIKARLVATAVAMLGLNKAIAVNLDPDQPVRSLLDVYNLCRYPPAAPTRLLLPVDARNELALGDLASDQFRPTWRPRRMIQFVARFAGAASVSRKRLTDELRTARQQVADAKTELERLRAPSSRADLAAARPHVRQLRKKKAQMRETEQALRSIRMERSFTRHAIVNKPGEETPALGLADLPRMRKQLVGATVFRAARPEASTAHLGTQVITVFAGASQDRDVTPTFRLEPSDQPVDEALIPLCEAMAQRGWDVVVFGGDSARWPRAEGIHLAASEGSGGGSIPPLAAIAKSRLVVGRGLMHAMQARLIGRPYIHVDAHDPWLHYPTGANDLALFGPITRGDDPAQSIDLTGLARAVCEDTSRAANIRIWPASGAAIAAAVTTHLDRLGATGGTTSPRDLRASLWRAFGTLVGSAPDDGDALLGAGQLVETSEPPDRIDAAGSQLAEGRSA